jgi:hypothetical protein
LAKQNIEEALIDGRFDAVVPEDCRLSTTFRARGEKKPDQPDRAFLERRRIS